MKIAYSVMRILQWRSARGVVVINEQARRNDIKPGGARHHDRADRPAVVGDEGGSLLLPIIAVAGCAWTAGAVART